VLSVVRDRQDRTKEQYVATVTIKTNKNKDSLSSRKTDKYVVPPVVKPLNISRALIVRFLSAIESAFQQLLFRSHSYAFHG